jgi:hypothetical protein
MDSFHTAQFAGGRCCSGYPREAVAATVVSVAAAAGGAMAAALHLRVRGNCYNGMRLLRLRLRRLIELL